MKGALAAATGETTAAASPRARPLVPEPAGVLYVELSRSPSYGGTKRVVVNLVGALDRGRFRPHALFYRDGPWVADLEAMGVPVAVIPSPMAAPRPEPGGRSGSRALARVKGLGVTTTAAGEPRMHPLRQGISDVLSWWRLLGPDARRARRLLPRVPAAIRLIHVNHSMVSDFAWFHVARRLGVPFVAHEHGIWKPRPAAYRVVAAGAASVLCLTEERVDRLRAFLGGRVRADFLPNGIPVGALEPRRDRDSVRTALGVPREAALIITAGHVQRWKGQRLAIEAAALLARRGLDFTWLLCGAELEPGYAEDLRRRLAEAGLQRRVRLLGERADLPDLFAASDLAVHTSIQPEPFGLVILEAMLQGCPVVGPREGSLPTLVRDGVDGGLVPARDPEALAAAIQDLLGRPEARQAMGAAARARVRETYDVRFQARRLEAIYERALARGAGARR